MAIITCFRRRRVIIAVTELFESSDTFHYLIRLIFSRISRKRSRAVVSFETFEATFVIRNNIVRSKCAS